MSSSCGRRNNRRRKLTPRDSLMPRSISNGQVGSVAMLAHDAICDSLWALYNNRRPDQACAVPAALGKGFQFTN